MEITQLIISEYKEVPLALTPMGRVSASIIDNLGGCLKFKPANKVFLSSSLWGSNTMQGNEAWSGYSSQDLIKTLDTELIVVSG